MILNQKIVPHLWRAPVAACDTVETEIVWRDEIPIGESYQSRAQHVTTCRASFTSSLVTQPASVLVATPKESFRRAVERVGASKGYDRAYRKLATRRVLVRVVAYDRPKGHRIGIGGFKPQVWASNFEETLSHDES